MIHRLSAARRTLRGSLKKKIAVENGRPTNNHTYSRQFEQKYANCTTKVIVDQDSRFIQCSPRC